MRSVFAISLSESVPSGSSGIGHWTVDVGHWTQGICQLAHALQTELQSATVQVEVVDQFFRPGGSSRDPVAQPVAVGLQSLC